MTVSKKIIQFIRVIRDSFDESIQVYSKGSCYEFYLILKEVFPEANCYTNIDHCITEIDEIFYDIRGIYPENGYDTYSGPLKDYMRIEEVYSKETINKLYSK